MHRTRTTAPERTRDKQNTHAIANSRESMSPLFGSPPGGKRGAALAGAALDAPDSLRGVQRPGTHDTSSRPRRSPHHTDKHTAHPAPGRRRLGRPLFLRPRLPAAKNGLRHLRGALVPLDGGVADAGEVVFGRHLQPGARGGARRRLGEEAAEEGGGVWLRGGAASRGGEQRWRGQRRACWSRRSAACVPIGSSLAWTWGAGGGIGGVGQGRRGRPALARLSLLPDSCPPPLDRPRRR